MTMPGAAQPGRRMEVRVLLRWLPGHTPWWDVHPTGSPAQLASSLNELATRIEVDTVTRAIQCAHPNALIHYTLVLATRGTVLSHQDTTVTIGELPARLRAHAHWIRTGDHDEPPNTRRGFDSR
ncbi:hypothetical protein ACTD5D_22745 [Nocardia takedensis]|uniref:hypothetical protein n=1 Tax=Nocardia takedensis TaxID=259390 RepID=UPI003F76DF0C